MTIRTNPELALLLKAAGSKQAQLVALDAALTSTKRVKAKRAPAGTVQEDVWTTGTLFRDAALTGSMSFTGVEISAVGVTSDLATCLAADLSTGVSVLRIEGNGHWLEGTLGLAGSGADFTLPANPTTSNSFAIAGTFRLKGVASLPDTTPAPAPPPPEPIPGDTTAPIVSLAVASGSVTASGTFALTATASDNVGVTKVEFYRDSLLVSTANASPWTGTDFLTLANNGTRAYTAKAYDAAGNVTVSTAQSVTVNISGSQSGGGASVGAKLTDFTIENTQSSTATNVPFTMGQAFAPGHLPGSGAGITLKLADNSTINAQLDVKALHADGSVRHAIISGVVPSMTAGEIKTINILRRDASADSAPAAVTLASQVAAGLNATVSIVDGGVTYTTSIAQLASTATLKAWLSGSVANEWLLSGPLKDSGGNQHPLIHARFYVRAYIGLNRAKIDIALENTWVIPNPSPNPNNNPTLAGNAWLNNSPGNVTYDVSITVPGDPGYSKAGIVHYDKARWAQTFWWNGDPAPHVKHNVPYLLSTKATPNYRQDLSLDAQTVADYLTKLNANNDPMKVGVSVPYMGTTGARVDIAINPSWTVLWLLFGDKTMKKVSVRTSQLTGGWSVNYRNKATDNWVSIKDNPYASTMSNISVTGSDDWNPTTRLHEKLPLPATSTNNPNGISSYHLHNPCYIPYLLTGDFFHLEQLQAWTEFSCGIEYLPAYRNFGNGAVYRDEPRGVAWRMRHLINVAYISPEGDPVKARTLEAINWNINWFDTYHTNSTDPITGNALGFLNNPSYGCNAVQYRQWYGSTGDYVAVGSYQDDFFTSVIGHAVEQGFTNATPLMLWKSKFSVGRMTSGTDFCWQLATANALDARASATGPLYTTWAEVWNSQATPAMKAAQCGTQAMADAIGAKTGENMVINQMTRYASGDVDYVAQGGAAFAYVADSGHPKGHDVWLVYEGRSVKQAFKEPSFAIVPRTV